MRDIGLDLYYKTTVGDNEERITQVLNLAWIARPSSSLGGLGLTVDDVTRQARPQCHRSPPDLQPGI
ncbi:MAG: hypothetical protein U0401_10180 [Anaerolineae bacterium]